MEEWEKIQKLLYGEFFMKCSTVSNEGVNCPGEGVHNIEGSNDFLCEYCYKSLSYREHCEKFKKNEKIF